MPADQQESTLAYLKRLLRESRDVNHDLLEGSRKTIDECRALLTQIDVAEHSAGSTDAPDRRRAED